MKNYLFTFFLLALCLAGFTQSEKFQIAERQTPVTKAEKLQNAVYITDLSPILWSSLDIPRGERYFLDHRRINESPQPLNYIYPQEKYKQVIEYVSVEISAMADGKVLKSKSSSDKLSAEQKAILNNSKLGSIITVKVKYKYKDQKPDDFGARNNVVEGTCQVLIVPDTEAEFPGGLKQLSEYLADKVIKKSAEKNAGEILRRATVSLTIDENGQIADAKIVAATANAEIDQLLLQALYKMPKWKPATNSRGEKVKQELTIPFSFGC